MKNELFLELENLIFAPNNEVHRKDNFPLPVYFYIGTGKTGSRSIVSGLNKTSAHWHDEKYFERIYKTDILHKNDIKLFDIILYLSKKYKFKPLIIEAYRDPISISISSTFQRITTRKIKLKNDKDPNEVIQNIELYTPIPYSLKWNDYFKVDLLKQFNPKDKYLFINGKDANLLFLRFENINLWPKIFKKFGYIYTPLHENKSSRKLGEDVYNKVLNKYKLDESFLRNFYNNEIMNSIYLKSEIEGFINRWKK